MHEATGPFPPLTGIRGFTEMKFGPINILGVAGGNSTNTSAWDVYKVYAHINITHFNNTVTVYSCCMKYERPINLIGKFPTKTSFLYKVHKNIIGLFHFVCENKYHKLGVRPVGVAITADGGTCSTDDVVFIEPDHPLRKPGSNLIICAKFAFQKIDAMLILEWMEANKLLGVDKIVAYYVADLNKDALKVLNYYATTGLLDLYFFKPSWEGKINSYILEKESIP